jgi:polyribonucleotide nucleotidyltransferase
MPWPAALPIKTPANRASKKSKSERWLKVTEEFGEENHGRMETMAAERYFDKLKKHIIRDVVLTDSKRLDGRKTDEVRPIWCEVDYLPSTHGSAVFSRGETQSLTSLTLGTKARPGVDRHRAGSHTTTNSILHYNFPPYSTGEVKPMRGPGRREVGPRQFGWPLNPQGDAR